jgi:hypothetical protein
VRPDSIWRFYRADLDMLTECTISRETDGTWLLAVWQNEFLTVFERCPTRAGAVQLSNQIWAHFLEQGWAVADSADV